MKERESLMRPVARRGGSAVYVASLAVLALTPGDLGYVLAGLALRGDTLTAIDDGTIVEPDATPDQIATAKENFRLAARRVGDYGKPGGMVSGERRAAEARGACERIRERWGMPSDQWPTTVLCEEVGVSRPTAFQYLGKRSIAQRVYIVAEALAQRNRSRRKNHAEA